MPGAYVFPGGAVDTADASEAAFELCRNLDDTAASHALSLPAKGLSYFIAAIRECFEEAGVLLARSVDTGEEVRFDHPAIEARFNSARHRVHEGTLDLIELCKAEGLRLMTDRIQYTAHWVTPMGESRRFDTRFFLARAPHAQVPLHDDNETIASLWVNPAVALERERAGELVMLPPTIACLKFLEPHRSADLALAAAAAIGVPPRILPKVRFAEPGSRVEVVLPGVTGYDDMP